jgi:uncharacterized membrane protein/ketosteroid isomerase-like protein
MIEIIPNWHPVLVHFTIALLTIAALLFLAAAFAGRNRAVHGIETTANWNLWLGAGLTVLTVAAGLQAAGSITHDDAAHLAMDNHKFWALGTTVLFLLVALWNAWRVRRGHSVGVAFTLAMVIALAGLTATGLRGADLVYRHGLGVMALPQQVADGGHDHESGAEHSHAETDATEGGHAPAVANTPKPISQSRLSPAEAEVVAALTAYHAALTSGDAAAPEAFVLADERFLMIEGKHFNQGWTDYRDNHLKAELADLAKVRFRLSILGIQVDGDLATVSFMFNVLPKSGPEMDFGGGRASASLVRAGDGWKLQQLHTS